MTKGLTVQRDEASRLDSFRAASKILSRRLAAVRAIREQLYC